MIEEARRRSPGVAPQCGVPRRNDKRSNGMADHACVHVGAGGLQGGPARTLLRALKGDPEGSRNALAAA
jgi:hypothetical protein